MTLFGSVGAPTRLPPAADIGFLLAVAIVIGCGYWGILTSRTSIDGQHIAQTWLWHEKVAIVDITQVKLVRVQRLDLLVVPLLVVRAGYGLTTIQTGGTTVHSQFRLLPHGG
ncbi:MAG TPA: hypothetical protein PKV56_15535 [Burkholderiaceae bacterium]|jgi:hypothetical protein|nr:hypothetical protein [Piscinibacter sp.]HOX69272.1 hypothetical protein [Burkholderiaceae bacterium]